MESTGADASIQHGPPLRAARGAVPHVVATPRPHGAGGALRHGVSPLPLAVPHSDSGGGLGAGLGAGLGQAHEEGVVHN